jgi:CelD/BcsL family acetyltransferase involved in cellulose biosynthesis
MTQSDHHGDIRFYGYDEHRQRAEFLARFTEGKLAWIKRME